MSHTSSPHAVDRITPLTSLVRLLEENGMKPHEIPSHQTIIIGDVHGCLKELKELIERAEFDQERGDQIVFVGDLIGKGPFSLQVLDFVLSLPVRYLFFSLRDLESLLPFLTLSLYSRRPRSWWEITMMSF